MATLWANGLLILDTNALLNLFRYSQRAREDFLKALIAKTDSLWIPHQVGTEFHRRRIGVINEQSKAFGEIEKALEKVRGQVDNAFNTYTRHPSLEISPLQAEFGEAVTAIVAKLHTAREDHRTNMVARSTNDEIFAQITDLFEGRVGAAFTDDELSKTYAEGAVRYDKHIPPGYKDADKGAPGKYGDLVLWKQTLAHVTVVKRPAIFVTNDQKEDWWYIVDSERHGGRPELIEEYYAAAGERVHFMTTERFLEFAKTQVEDIRTESITELEDLAKETADRQSLRVKWTSRKTSRLRPLWESHRMDEEPEPGITAHGNYDLAEATTLLAEVSESIRNLRRDRDHLVDRVTREGPSPQLEQQIALVEERLASARRIERIADRHVDIALDKARAKRMGLSVDETLYATPPVEDPDDDL